MRAMVDGRMRTRERGRETAGENMARESRLRGVECLKWKGRTDESKGTATYTAKIPVMLPSLLTSSGRVVLALSIVLHIH